MKKLIFITLLLYIGLATIIVGCNKEEEEKEKTCNNGKEVEKGFSATGQSIVTQMKRGDGQTHVFYWQIEADKVCPKKDVAMNFRIDVESYSYFSMQIGFSSTIVTPSGTNISSQNSNAKSAIYNEGGIDYTMFATGIDNIVTLCSDCDPLKTISYSMRITLKVDETISDPLTYVIDNVKEVTLTTYHDEPGEP